MTLGKSISYADLRRRKAVVGERVRCWTHRGGRDGELGTVVRRRNTGYGFRAYDVKLDTGRTVYMCQGAIWGFYCEAMWQAWLGSWAARARALAQRRKGAEKGRLGTSTTEEPKHG